MLICILTKNVITSCSVTMMLFLHLEVKPLMTLTTVLYLSSPLISGTLAMVSGDVGKHRLVASGGTVRRYVALAVTERGAVLLVLELERVVDFGPDAAMGEEWPKLIQTSNADDLLMVDMMGARVGPR